MNKEKPSPYTADNYYEEEVIKETLRIISCMTEGQRIEKAKAHVKDAIEYRNPRPSS
jgi:hypothetical protein